MSKPDKTKMQALLITLLMILTLPLFYLLVSRVLLPLEWNEPQFNSEERAERSVEEE